MDWMQVVFAAGVGAFFAAIGAAVGVLLVRFVLRGSSRTAASVSIGIAVVAGLVGSQVAGSQTFRDWLRPPSRIERAARPRMKALESSPKFRARTKGLTSAQASQLGEKLAHDGLKRLSPEELARWNDVRSKLAAGSPAVCAGFWTGKLDPKMVGAAIDALPDPDLDAWAGISIRALQLEVEAEGPAQVAADELMTGLGAVRESLDAGEQARFDAALAAGAALADDDACAVMKHIFKAGATLPEAPRQALLRGLAAL